MVHPSDRVINNDFPKMAGQTDKLDGSPDLGLTLFWPDCIAI